MTEYYDVRCAAVVVGGVVGAAARARWQQRLIPVLYWRLHAVIVALLRCLVTESCHQIRGSLVLAAFHHIPLVDDHAASSAPLVLAQGLVGERMAAGAAFHGDAAVNEPRLPVALAAPRWPRC
jgi:hypothetical protein